MNDLKIGQYNDRDNGRISFFAILMILTTSLVLQLSGCAKEKQQARPAEEIPVKTGKAINMDVPMNVSAIGTVQAYSTVNIVSHVGGQIMQVHVKEGQTIKKGQPLFNIDDRSYQTALETARISLEKDRIQLEKEKTDAQRYAELLKKDYVTKEEAEQAQNDVAVREATIKGDETDVKNAELNLSYCQITAPMDGRAGSILVNQGNIITATNNSDPLMVINQIQPIYIRFSVPEQYLAEIQAQLNLEPKVQISMPEKPDEIKEGRLTFIDNSIDTNTGTIELKAAFDNPDNALWPGQFVNVTLVLGVKTGAIVTPSDAVQMSQDGNYIFVVKADNTVESRNVKIGSEVGDQTEIKEGISLGETVVTDGQLKLSPGARISIKNGTEAGSGVKK